MFDADRPIIKSSQDRLNRSLFAKYLARSLLDHKDPESLVVGLYGGWGSGKTSLINLVIEELNFAASNLEDEEKPIILNFNPWSYSGQNQLIYSFFRRLSSTLRGVSYLENKDRIVHLLELYVSFFTHQAVPESLRTKRSLVEKLTFSGKEEIYAWESGRDLTLVKAELNELLRQQKHKIIILIDNISRLYDREIKQIFQIVKSMGDYANTAYLLALDKEHILRALNRLDEGSGDETINKMVQLPFDVPPILQQDIEAILADRLNNVLKMVPEESWNIDYWADIYYSSLKYFFRNCRDITRYVNTLSFSYPRLRDVVNPVDFFALTAIEVFLPAVYLGIRDNKDLFTDLLDNVYEFDARQIEDDKFRANEIINRSENFPKPFLLELLLRLFPRLRKIYRMDSEFYHSDALARKLKRICSPDLFDAYFRLSMQPGQIPPSEFETVLALAFDPISFDQALTRLNQDDRITKFLNQLDSKLLERIPETHIPAIINALLDNGDLFPLGECGPLSLDTPRRIHRIIHTLLRREKTPDARFLLLQTAIANATKSIFIIVYELKEQGREHLEEEDTFLPLAFRDLTPDQLESLQKLAASRIESWATSERLQGHPQLIALLYAWREWGDAASCHAFVKKITDTDRGLVAFLVAALAEAILQAMTQYEKNPSWLSGLETIQAFISIDQIKDHAIALFEDAYFEKLSEKEQLAIVIFLDLIHAQTVKVIPKTSP